MNAEIWNTFEDRAALEQLCHAAKVPPHCANLPWLQLSENIKQRLAEAWAMRGEG